MGNPMEASIFLTKAKMDKILPAGLLWTKLACGLILIGVARGQELKKKKNKKGVG